MDGGTKHTARTLCLTQKKKRLTINEQKNERKNANASTKSKELQPSTQSQRYAAHLLLPQPNNRHLQLTYNDIKRRLLPITLGEI